MEKSVDSVPNRKRNKRKGIDGPVAQTIVWVLLIVEMFLVISPLMITFSLSLKQPFEHTVGDIWALPANAQWHYYGIAVKSILPYVLNTLIVCVLTTLGVVLFSSITAYVFARHNFIGKEVIFSLIIALMMVPSVLTMTPQYLVVESFNLINTRWALIIPGIAGGQVGAIMLFRTFFQQQPSSVFEAATIDGANDVVMYAKLSLPLAVPVLIIQALGTFSLMYSDFLWPMLVVKDDAIKTLMAVMTTLKGTSLVQKDPGILYAMYLLSGVPLILVSLFGLKYAVSGDFTAGMKL